MTTPATEFPAVLPSVYVDGDEASFFCLNVEANFGKTPGKALFKWGNPTMDITGPITLNAEGTWQYGARIVVVDDSGDNFNIYHLGQLLRRHDQGLANQLLLTSLDDRHWLNRIPVRGCLVYDSTTTPYIKFIRRFDPRMNPEGYWNMTFITWGDGYMPVFAPKAAIGYSYQIMDKLYAPVYGSVTDDNIGQIYPWTPRWAMYYWWFLTQLDPTMNIPGICSDYPTGPDYWRSLTACTRLTWKAEVMTPSVMIGADPAYGGTDPLDRNMPDTGFRTMTLLGVIAKTLDVAGTHDLQLMPTPADLDDPDPSDCYSAVNFMPISWAAVSEDTTTVLSIPLVRGGQLATSNTAFDFDIRESADEVCEVALVEAANVHEESFIGCPVNQSGPILWAWTTAEETAFKQILYGQAQTGVPSGDRFCIFPPSVNQTSPDDIPAITDPSTGISPWLKADGNDGRPLIYRNTPDAIAFAWKFYPRVYRAFKVDSVLLGAILVGDSGYLMNGSDQRFANRSQYPVLTSNRQILSQQLQFFMNNLDSNLSDNNLSDWTKNRLPVRMEILTYAPNGSSLSQYYELPHAPQIKIDGEGLLWIDGIHDENNIYSSVYNGKLMWEGGIWAVTMKEFWMNCAYPLDERVIGTFALQGEETSIFTDDYNTQLGGPMVAYADNRQSWHEDHQNDSSPTAANDPEISGADGPQTRLLPPGDESPFAAQAAQRLLYNNKLPTRESVFRIIGIRPEIYPGLWVDQVTIINGADTDSNYLMNSALNSVVYDFMAQETLINGLQTMVSAKNKPSMQGTPLGYGGILGNASH